MSAVPENAKKIFVLLFRPTYEAQEGNTGWALPFELGREYPGLEDMGEAARRGALSFLVQKRLLQHRGTTGYMLGPLGPDACISEMFLDERLGLARPGVPVPAVQHVTINGPGQVGHGNVQNITTITQQASVAIERDTTMTEAQKSEAKDFLGKIRSAAEGLVAHVAKAGAGAAVVEVVKHLLG